MILTKTVEVRIHNQGAHYKSLGYNVKQGDTISVPVEHLYPGTWLKLECRCSDCGKTYKRPHVQIKKAKFLCRSCTRLEIGKTCDRTKLRLATASRSGSKHPRWNPNKSAFLEYARKVRWLSEKTYKKHMRQINPNNLPRALCGVEGGYQLDHKTSIKEGFDNQLKPEVIAAVGNLQMLPWRINREKHSR
jgi:hypothetical protein